MSPTRCPEPETLVAYVRDQLNDEELVELSHHLVECERCYGTVAASVRELTAIGRPADIAPAWALAPALMTGTVMAVGLTIALLLLQNSP